MLNKLKKVLTVNQSDMRVRHENKKFLANLENHRVKK